MHPNRTLRESTPRHILRATASLALASLAASAAPAADTPMFVDGQAQVVEAFSECGSHCGWRPSSTRMEMAGVTACMSMSLGPSRRRTD